MAKKTRKRNEDVESYLHESDTRKNAVPVGLASYDISKPKPEKYEYDTYLDPQLIYSGGKEHSFFEAPELLWAHYYKTESGLVCFKISQIDVDDKTF